MTLFKREADMKKTAAPDAINTMRPRLFQFLTLLVSVLVAIAMWYLVSVRDRLEAQVEVNIDYYGIPPNLVVTEGLISKVTVRLRGPETLLKSIPRDRLTQSINLSHIKKGINVVPLGSDYHLGPNFRAFELIDIQPPKIVLKVDALSEKRVPLLTVMDSPLKGGGLTVENVTVSPATAIIRGPEEEIAKISSLPLTIMLDPKSTGRTVTQTITLDTPSLVTSIPAAAQVSYTITSGRTVLSRTCKIGIAGDDTHNFVLKPAEINILVEVPEAYAKNAKYLSQLEVSVTPPALEPGQSDRVKLRFRLPEGMTLLNKASEDVLISRPHEKH